MRIGLIVDGNSEFGAMSRLFEQLAAATGNMFVKRLQAKLHPHANPNQIATVCNSRMPAFRKQDVDLVIVLIDRETQDLCSGKIAGNIKEAIQALTTTPRVEVVVKDRTFENWLIADTMAIQALPGRFDPKKWRSFRRRAESGNADLQNAILMLNGCVMKGNYHKVEDSQQVLARADINRMAANSRSFRRFLRCVGHPDFQDQSKTPVVNPEPR